MDCSKNLYGLKSVEGKGVLNQEQQWPPNFNAIHFYEECRFKLKSENTRGSITVQLNSCLFCLGFYFAWHSDALLMLNEQQFTCLVKSKPVKQEVSLAVILPPMASVHC